MSRLGKLERLAACMLILLGVVLNPARLHSHPDKNLHANEIINALGFEYNNDIYGWLCFISSDMIDKHQPFYSRLTARFPGFKCKHRVLFHWNYNGIPWTPGLEEKVRKYTVEKYGKDNFQKFYPSTKEAFLTELRKEQKRRNKIINERTERLFGFASGGKDASYANFFASMAYDLHLLGDYTSYDNSDFFGLVEFNTLINGIISSINRFDSREGKKLVKAIKKELKTTKRVQYKADAIMEIIQKEMPSFVKSAQNGSISRRLEKRGFKFR